MPTLDLRFSAGGAIADVSIVDDSGDFVGTYNVSLPTATFAPAYVARTGTVLTVPSGGDLQAALNAAVPGDVIVLDAGAVYSTAANYVLPTKTGGANDIYVVSAPVQAGTFSTPEGQRITSGAQTATIRHIGVSNVSPTLSTTGAGRTGWRFVGITFDTAPGSTYDLNSLVQIGNPAESNIANYPGRIVFDRCRFFGLPLQNIRRAVWFTGPECAVLDSQILDINTGVSDGDSQGVLVTSYALTGTIRNCEIGGPTESVVFGGLDTNAIADTTVVPQDWTVNRCYFHHNLYQDEDEGGGSWNGVEYSTKNLIETKAGRRILFQDLVIGRHLGKDQQFLATIKSDKNDVRVTPCEDVVIRNLKCIDVMAVVQTRGFDDSASSARLQRVYVDNVAIYRARATTRITPRIVQCTGWGRQLEFTRITAILPRVNDNSVMTFVDPDPSAVMQDVRITNSIFDAAYGMQVPGNVDFGISTNVTGDRVATGLVLTGRSSALYSSTNIPGAYPATAAAIGFESYANSETDDLVLDVASPVKGLLPSGRDPGADIPVLLAATAGCVTGVWS